MCPAHRTAFALLTTVLIASGYSGQAENRTGPSERLRFLDGFLPWAAGTLRRRHAAFAPVRDRM